MKAVILAGGFATRLQGVIATPKCLVDIGGKTVLDHQVELLRRGGVSHVRLALHHRADEIRAYARRFGPGFVSSVVERQPLGTGGAIKYATRGLREPVIVLNGDILSDLDARELWEESLAARSHTLALVPWSAKDFGNVELLGDRIIGFREKSQSDVPQWVSLGAYVIFPGIFENFPDQFSIEKECFPRLARRGVLRAYFHRGKFLDIGTPERFQMRTEVLQ